MGLFTKRVLNRVLSLPVNAIESNPFQPRLIFDEQALQELAQSIEENGLLQPVTVRKIEEKRYELIAGERRLQACRLIGKEEIAAIVEEFTDEQAAVFALVENLQRRDLNFFEEAIGIQVLMQHHGLTQQQVANQLSKAQSTIANKLRLLAFDNRERDYMLQVGLTERHARAMLKLVNTKLLRDALNYIVENRLNVGETERYIEKLLSSETPAQQKPPATRLFVVKDLRIFMNTISKAVDTMKLAGIEINTEQEEDEEYINYTMRIPKKSAYRQSAQKEQHGANAGVRGRGASHHYSA